MWDSRSKGLFAHLIPAKGTDFEGLEAVLKLFTADLDRLGYERSAFRTDNEFAIIAFLNELKRHWQGEVIPEAASTGDPQSNGAAERGVRMIKDTTRRQRRPGVQLGSGVGCAGRWCIRSSSRTPEHWPNDALGQI